MAPSVFEKCGICREETTDYAADFVALPCAGRHAFHPDCIKPWLSGAHKLKGDCPLCRAPLHHTCGHNLAVQHLRAGKAIDSSVLDGPCRPGCHPGVQTDLDVMRRFGSVVRQRLMDIGEREAQAEQERIRLRLEELNNKLSDLQRQFNALVAEAISSGLLGRFPHTILYLQERYDRARRELLGFPPRDDTTMPNPLRAGLSSGNLQPPQHYQSPQLHPILESAFGSNVSNMPSLFAEDDDDGIE